MNRVVLIGRLTKDPAERYTASQIAATNFTIAINRPKKEDGTEVADFPRILAFGKTAEICVQYLHKGQRVAIEGRLQTSSYKNKNGDMVYSTDVLADRVEIIDWPEKHAEKPNKARISDVEAQFEAVDDDVPF